MPLWVYDDDLCRTKGDAVAIWLGAFIPIVALVAFMVWLFF